MENETKTCPKCGRTLTIDNFYQRGDGRLYTYCKECVKANNRKYRNTPPDSENPLSTFTPRQLMQELVRRGYTGKLKLVTINEIDLNKWQLYTRLHKLKGGYNEREQIHGREQVQG